jgi:glycosyltransferase involved in cell wall biosynthesis
MLSIIIPTLNEEEGIGKVICLIPEEIKKQSEIIVVDVSTDCTPIIAEKLGARVIRVEKKGKGRQMRQAVENSRGETLIFLDGDGTDPPQYIPKLIEKLETANIVLGCRSMKRFKSDDRMMRSFFIFYRFYMWPIFRLINLNVSDPLAGFRAIRRKDWDELDLKSDYFEIETEMNIKAMKKGFVIKEVAIPNLKRGGGLNSSKLIADPKMWLRIIQTSLKYFNDEKIKSKIASLESRLKSQIKALKRR